LTYAFDQKGFGKTSTRGYWSGNKAYLDDLKTAIKFISVRHSEIPLFMSDESMGGAVALTAIILAFP
jgi:acylglycerol lipase